MDINKLMVSDTSKTHHRIKILDRISFECQTNEITSIFGANGSGKSTLFKIILGLIKPDEGKLIINGEKIDYQNIIKSKNIGYLPQNSFLPKNLKVSKIVRSCFKDCESQDKVFYEPLINIIEKKNVGALSFGELRYFEFVLLCNMEHKFLLLDEPFSMVDPKVVELIKEKLLLLKTIKAIVLTDHHYYDVLDISDKNFVIKNTKVISIENHADLITYDYLRQ